MLRNSILRCSSFRHTASLLLGFAHSTQNDYASSAALGDYPIAPSGARATNNVVSTDGAIEKKKRGRKPGSKNKPKATPHDILRQTAVGPLPTMDGSASLAGQFHSTAEHDQQLATAVHAAQDAAFDANRAAIMRNGCAAANVEGSGILDQGEINNSQTFAIGEQRVPVSATISRIGAAALALRAIGKVERMPDEALELIESAAANAAHLLSLDIEVMFKTSVPDSYALLRAVSDLTAAVEHWELHAHAGPMPQIGAHVQMPSGDSPSTVDVSGGGGGSASGAAAHWKRRAAANSRLLNDIASRNRPESLLDCQRKQKELLRSLRFVTPRSDANGQPSAAVAEGRGGDVSCGGARLLQRFLYTLLMWGGDRVGTTHARTVLAIRISTLFQQSPHEAVRDEAHELLSYFIRYFSTDFCSHARLHVPDIALLVVACTKLKLLDPFTWGGLSDAAAKVQSSFHSGDKRWLMQKVGTVVPRGLRGLPSSSSAAESSLADTAIADSAFPTFASRPRTFGDVARPRDVEGGVRKGEGGGGRGGHAQAGGGDDALRFAPMTCSGFAHLSVRETFMLTSQVGAVGTAIKKMRKHSGDKAVYERYLFQQLVDGLRGVSPNPRVASSPSDDASSAFFGDGNALPPPGGLPIPSSSDATRAPNADAAPSVKTLRKALVVDLLEAALILASHHRSQTEDDGECHSIGDRNRCNSNLLALPMAHGPRRRLFMSCLARAQMDLSLLTHDERLLYTVKFEALLARDTQCGEEALSSFSANTRDGTFGAREQMPLIIDGSLEAESLSLIGTEGRGGFVFPSMPGAAGTSARGGRSPIGTAAGEAFDPVLRIPALTLLSLLKLNRGADP